MSYKSIKCPDCYDIHADDKEFISCGEGNVQGICNRCQTEFTFDFQETLNISRKKLSSLDDFLYLGIV